MSFRRGDIAPATVVRGASNSQLAQQMLPLVLELPGRADDADPTANRPDLAGIERIASATRFQQNRGQVCVDRRSWRVVLPKSMQLRVAAITPGFASQHRLRQQGFSPKRHETLRIQVSRMDGPESHVLTTAFTLTQTLGENSRQHGSDALNSSSFSVQRILSVTEAQLEGLPQVLIDCVEGGASVSFMHPLQQSKALAFWRRVGESVVNGERALLIAEQGSCVIGTVQLILEQPENQPHRADLSKMLVHRRARRQGVGAALLRKAEDVAREYGKTLLVLDTASGDAERLYARTGWQRCGHVPDYALLPYGGLCATSFYYRRLAPESA